MNESKKTLRIITMAIAIVFMLCMSASALAESFQARINSSSARVYNVPSTSSKVYVSGGRGITVTVTGYAGGWARVSYRGNTGYIQSKYLNLKDRLKAYTAKSTPVYRQASSSSGRMGTLKLGTAVYVVGKDGGYYRIQNASGSVTGYVQTNALTTRAKLMAAYNAYKKAQAAANNSNASSGSSSNAGSSSSGSSSSGSTSSGTGTVVTSKIDKVIALAKSLIGKPYATSDNPPNSFNCSSFVEYCMEKYGYSMEGTAVKQAAMSNKVSKSNIQKGDVLCFDTDGDDVCDHTAIYLGNSQFIEASQNAGKVWINDLDSTYKGFLMWAIRPK